MPLIEILTPPQPPLVEVPAICRKVNAAVASAIPCRLDAVLTTWRTIDGAYVRGDVVAGAPSRAEPSRAGTSGGRMSS
jgi:hypothetical protein